MYFNVIFKLFSNFSPISQVHLLRQPPRKRVVMKIAVMTMTTRKNHQFNQLSIRNQHRLPRKRLPRKNRTKRKTVTMMKMSQSKRSQFKRNQPSQLQKKTTIHSEREASVRQTMAMTVGHRINSTREVMAIAKPLVITAMKLAT